MLASCGGFSVRLSVRLLSVCPLENMQTDLQFRIAGDCCCPPAVGLLNVLHAAIYASYANSFIGHQFDVMGIGIYTCLYVFLNVCLPNLFISVHLLYLHCQQVVKSSYQSRIMGSKCISAQ